MWDMEEQFCFLIIQIARIFVAIPFLSQIATLLITSWLVKEDMEEAFILNLAHQLEMNSWQFSDPE